MKLVVMKHQQSKYHLNKSIRIPKKAFTLGYPPAILVYGWLKEREGMQVPPQKEIAELLKVSLSTVNKALNVLKVSGLVWIDRKSPSELNYYLSWDDKPAIMVAAEEGCEHAKKQMGLTTNG